MTKQVRFSYIDIAYFEGPLPFYSNNTAAADKRRVGHFAVVRIVK